MKPRLENPDPGKEAKRARAYLVLARTGAWLIFAAIATLTLAPPSLRVSTGEPHALEHLAAFTFCGAAFALAYPEHRRAIWLWSFLVLGLLELLQLVAPGRHARVSDYVMNVLGAGLGIFCVAVAGRIRRRILTGS
jgi:hypothetical protein